MSYKFHNTSQTFDCIDIININITYIAFFPFCLHAKPFLSVFQHLGFDSYIIKALEFQKKKKNCPKKKKAMLGNGVVGILSESLNKWERRVPLTPSHCARLLHGGEDRTGISRIIVQPSTKRVHHDALYEDVGCEISEDLSQCGLILGIKQPKVIKK